MVSIRWSKFVHTLARRLSIVAAVSGVLTAAAAGAPKIGHKHVGSAPTVSFDSKHVIATVTPGAMAYFAALSISSAHYTTSADQPAAIIAASDKDGHVTFETTVQSRSVWIVVDAKSGGYTVASPEGLLRDINFPGNSARAGANGVLHRIGIGRPQLAYVIIRPDTGMWGTIAFDGSPSDADRTRDYDATVDIEKLAPLAKSGPPPDHLAPGDIIFAVDLNTLASYDGKVGKP
jgi:hypothetical protein